MYDNLIDTAKQTYRELAIKLGQSYLFPKTIRRALVDIKDENTWLSKSGLEGYKDFFGPKLTKDETGAFFGNHSYGETIQAHQLLMSQLCTDYRDLFNSDILDEEFDFDLLEIGNQIVYKDYKAQGIIFCQGWRVTKNPYFKNLPFDPAKGEMLICKIPGLNLSFFMKQKLFFIPVGDELYWIGSTYDWNANDELPTAEKKVKLKSIIDEVLNLPYTVVDHKAGIRPTNKYRKPILGRHETVDHVFLFNGLGTKGASLGPYWAKYFCDQLLSNELETVHEFIQKVIR